MAARAGATGVVMVMLAGLTLAGCKRSTAMTPAAATQITGGIPQRGALAIRQYGCGTCHTIPGIPGATGTQGPKLEEGTNAPTRIKDPAYKGTAHSTPEYIMESVVSPSTYVVKGFPDNLMPKVFGQKLSAGALKKIVDYLSQVKAGAPPPKIS